MRQPLSSASPGSQHPLTSPAAMELHGGVVLIRAEARGQKYRHSDGRLLAPSLYMNWSALATA